MASKMEITAVHILVWLLTAFTLTAQKLVWLNVSHRINAECGKQVTLNCNTSPLNGLSIKHMEWSVNNKSLCFVNSQEQIHQEHTLSDFQCKYELGQLRLIFEKVHPDDSGDSQRYMCKLRSNRGVVHKYTTVKLQECCGIVEGVSSGHRHSCTFHHVHPDADVHWFQGSHNLTHGSLQNTIKRKRGWLTIHSHLERESSDIPFNCSLMTKTGRYIASTLVQNKHRALESQPQPISNGAGSQRPMMTFFCMTILHGLKLI